MKMFFQTLEIELLNIIVGKKKITGILHLNKS